MVSRDFQALNRRRVARCRDLARRYPASAQVLTFYSHLVEFQERVGPQARDREELATLLPLLAKLVREHGPEPLREAAKGLDASGLGRLLADYWKMKETSLPESFFARAVLQAHAAQLDFEPKSEEGRRCPYCSHLPQAAVLRPQGHGSTLSLMCSLCLREWPFGRVRCAACGESSARKLVYYRVEDFDHLRLQACESCRTYLHHVDLKEDPQGVPDVDELSALPLDVWARERGYRKQQLNMAGI